MRNVFLFGFYFAIPRLIIMAFLISYPFTKYGLDLIYVKLPILIKIVFLLFFVFHALVISRFWSFLFLWIFVGFSWPGNNWSFNRDELLDIVFLLLLGSYPIWISFLSLFSLSVWETNNPLSIILLIFIFLLTGMMAIIFIRNRKRNKLSEDLE